MLVSNIIIVIDIYILSSFKYCIYMIESSISGEDYLQDTEESDQYMMCVFVIDKKGESTITIGFMVRDTTMGDLCGCMYVCMYVCMYFVSILRLYNLY